MFKTIGEFHESTMRKYLKKLKKDKRKLAGKEKEHAKLIVGDNDMSPWHEEGAIKAAKHAVNDGRNDIRRSMATIEKCRKMAKLDNVTWPELFSLSPTTLSPRGVSLSAEFRFDDFEKQGGNRLVINIPSGAYGWDKARGEEAWRGEVFRMGQHKWTLQSTRSMTVLDDLKTALSKQIEWRTAFRELTADQLYRELCPGVGRYLSIHGYQNVLTGVGLDTRKDRVGIAVSTSIPQQTYSFILCAPHYAHESRVFDGPSTRQESAEFLFDMNFGRTSRSFAKSPRRFERIAEGYLSQFPVNTWSISPP